MIKFNRRKILQVLLSATGLTYVNASLASKRVTPKQTSGPFYPETDQLDKDLDLTRYGEQTQQAEGDVIEVEGQVRDEFGVVIAGAMVEIWQANKWGRYRHSRDPNKAPLDPNFQGWGQVISDKQGRYRFKTIVPGAYPANRDWTRPPHIHFKVLASSHEPLTTQMYFPQYQKLNAVDLILQSLSENEQLMLVAKTMAKPTTFNFDIILRKG